MQLPKIPSMIRGVKTNPRGFNYIPRYYDQDKEDFEKRVRLAEKELDSKSDDKEMAEHRVRMKLAIEEKWGYRHTPIHDRGRTRRLAIIFIGLIGILYALYHYSL